MAHNTELNEGVSKKMEHTHTKQSHNPAPPPPHKKLIHTHSFSMQHVKAGNLHMPLGRRVAAPRFGSADQRRSCTAFRRT